MVKKKVNKDSLPQVKPVKHIRLIDHNLVVVALTCSSMLAILLGFVWFDKSLLSLANTIHPHPVPMVKGVASKPAAPDLLKVAQVQAATPSASPSVKSATSSAQTAVQNWGRSVMVPILMYHYIGLNPNPADKLRDDLSVHPDIFDDQMSVLKAHGYSPITLETLYAAIKGQTALPAKPIILTFDDGYVDFYVNAFPILRKYGFHAVSFIPTGLMDQAYYLHWNQIKEMDATGLVAFEPHSVTHANLASLGQAELMNQLTESKQVLESHLGKHTEFMAYPYGVSNSYVWEAARKAGYLGSVGTWYGTTEDEGNIMDMPRIKVAGTWTKDIFAQRFP